MLLNDRIERNHLRIIEEPGPESCGALSCASVFSLLFGDQDR